MIWDLGTCKFNQEVVWQRNIHVAFVATSITRREATPIAASRWGRPVKICL